MQERINESHIDNVIKVFFYSTSCYIISTVFTCCQGLWFLDNCVHFSHWAHSKGLLFCSNAIFLSRRYRCSHAHYTHKHTKICTMLIFSCSILLLHTCAYLLCTCSQKHINSNENSQVPTHMGAQSCL